MIEQTSVPAPSILAPDKREHTSEGMIVRIATQYLPILCLIIAAVLFCPIAIVRFDAARVSDVHGFRQSQTAVTINALANGSPFLRYETPVLGYPWSIPFEFPLYQWLTACLMRLFHTPVA